jgi:hypothetical protein
MSLVSKKYERTGIYSVDLVAAAVEWHFVNLKRLKTIYLSGRLYNEFRKWAERNAGEEIEVLTFEHVEIKEKSKLLVLGNDITFDFWPLNKEDIN